jgi:hypothetical protein
VRYVRPGKSRNWPAVTVFPTELMEVEVAVLQTEVTKGSCWLKTALNITSLCAFAGDDVRLIGELLPEPGLLVILVCVERRADFDHLEVLAVLAEDDSFAVTGIGHEQLVAVDDRDEGARAHISRLSETSSEASLCNGKHIVLHPVKSFLHGSLYLIVGHLVTRQQFFEITMQLLTASFRNLPAAMTVKHGEKHSRELLSELVHAHRVFTRCI